jgi:hypothetical protein
MAPARGLPVAPRARAPGGHRPATPLPRRVLPGSRRFATDASPRPMTSRGNGGRWPTAGGHRAVTAWPRSRCAHQDDDRPDGARPRHPLPPWPWRAGWRQPPGLGRLPLQRRTVAWDHITGRPLTDPRLAGPDVHDGDALVLVATQSDPAGSTVAAKARAPSRYPLWRVFPRTGRRLQPRHHPAVPAGRGGKRAKPDSMVANSGATHRDFVWPLIPRDQSLGPS